MWVFGYGSLIWKADFPFEQKLVGYIKGFHRRFYQHSVDHRGVPNKPGRVVTLIPSWDNDAVVWGVAYKIGEKDQESVVNHLDFREKNGYNRATVVFHPKLLDKATPIAPFELTIYVASIDNESFAGEADIEKIAKQVVSSSGPSGSNKEYVYKLASAMRLIAPGVLDEHLFSLEAAVRRLDQSGQNPL